MAYNVQLEPRTGRYIVADAVRGVVPLQFTQELVARDFAMLLNCVATCPPRDEPLEHLPQPTTG